MIMAHCHITRTTTSTKPTFAMASEMAHLRLDKRESGAFRTWASISSFASQKGCNLYVISQLVFFLPIFHSGKPSLYVASFAKAMLLTCLRVDEHQRIVLSAHDSFGHRVDVCSRKTTECELPFSSIICSYNRREGNRDQGVVRCHAYARYSQQIACCHRLN